MHARARTRTKERLVECSGQQSSRVQRSFQDSINRWFINLAQQCSDTQQVGKLQQNPEQLNYKLILHLHMPYGICHSSIMINGNTGSKEVKPSGCKLLNTLFAAKDTII